MSARRSSADPQPFELVPRERWTSKSNAERCVKCGSSFGIFRSAENCHSCGRVFCQSSCLEAAVALPGHPGTAPVPVCATCAVAIRRVQQDAEGALHRCRILEELLNEQAIQGEKLTSLSRALRTENEALLKERESLHVEIRRLELQKDVAAAQSELQSRRPSELEGSSATTSPTAGASGSDSEAERALDRRKKLLDMREVTLQEALKKVSSDAAKLVSQRAALQEQERTLRAVLTQQIAETFEAERQSLEAELLAECASLHIDFQDWVRGLPREVGLAAATTVSSDEELCSASHTAKAAQSLPRAQAELDASPQARAEEMQIMCQQHATVREVLEGELREANAARAAAERALEAVAVERTAWEEQQRQAQAWAEDKLTLQASIDALRHGLNEAHERERAREDEVMQLQRAMADAVAQREAAAAQLAAQQSQSQSQSQEQQVAQEQLADGLRAELRAAESARAALLVEAERQRAAAEASVTALRDEHEARVAGLRMDMAEERQRMASQHGCDLNELRKERDAAIRDLRSTHETALAELTRKHTLRERELQERLEAVHKRQKDGVEAVAVVQALHAELSARWENTLSSALATHSEKLSVLHSVELTAQRRAHAAELRAVEVERDELRQQCLTLQAEAESHLEQVRASQAAPRAPSMEAPLLQGQEQQQQQQESSQETKTAVDTTQLVEGLLLPLRLVSERALDEHAAALAVGLAYLRSATIAAAAVAYTEDAGTEEAARLQRQLKVVRHERQSQAQRALELAGEVREQKRLAAALAEELTDTKERWEKTKSAAARAERSAAAAQAQVAAAAAVTSAQAPRATAPSTTGDLVAVEALHASVHAWERRARAVLGHYADALADTIVHDVLSSASAEVATAVASLEKYREHGRRQAAALEQTTATVRTVQADLRARAQLLAAREETVERRERRAVELAEALRRKRRAVVEICGNLHAVLGKLREREHDAPSTDGSLASRQASTEDLLCEALSTAGLRGMSP